MDRAVTNIRIMASSSAAIDQTTTTSLMMTESSTEYDPNLNITGFQMDRINLEFPEYIRTASTLLCVIILVIGIIGNILVPVVVWRNKELRSSTNIFLVNLSVADLLVLILCVPTGLVELHTETEVWVLGATMCKFVPFAELSLTHASVLTILAISLERYIAICRPLQANFTCTRKRALLACIAIWIIGLIATSPVLVIAKHERLTYIDNSLKPSCIVEARSFWSSVYFLTSMIIFFFLPLFILIAIYWIISRNLMSDPCNTAAATRTICGVEHPNMKARKQVVIMLATVVFFFFICLLPLRILFVYIIVSPAEVVLNMGTEVYYNILYFSRLMLYANSAINPLLYNVMSSKFREAFFKVLGFNISPQRGRSRWLCRHLSRQSTFTTNSTTLPNSSVKSTFGFNSKMSTRHNHHQPTDSCRLKEITDSPCTKHVGRGGVSAVQVQAQQHHALALRSASGPYYPTKSILIPKKQLSSDEATVLTTSHPGNIRIIHKLEPTRANSVV